MIRYHTTWVIRCQIVMLLGAIIACKPAKIDPADLASFYYPIDKWPAGGITYVYKNKIHSEAPPEMWLFRKTGPGLMESINYDVFGDTIQKQYERFVSNGIVVDSLKLFASDTSGKKQTIPVKVMAQNRFPFNAGDSSKVWLTKFDWRQPGDSLHIVLSRRRRFVGQTQWTFEGKRVPAVRFKTEDMLETERDGWTTSTWSGEEIYARNLGLVYYRRNISEYMNMEFELAERK